MKAVLAKMFKGKKSGRRRIVLNHHPRSVFAIGDVHGCVELQRQLEAQILAEIGENNPTRIIYLGDLVDRGLHSAEVIDHCLSPLPDGVARLCLCGNHDQAFFDFLKKPSLKSEWFEFGGRETLLSYGIDVEQLQKLKLKAKDFSELIRQTIPQQHVAFLEALPVSVSTPWVHFVHAGMRPDVPMDDQSDEDLMWIRQEFLIDRHASDKMIIHGHTPAETPMIGPGRIGIDTAAYAGGPLTAIHIESGSSSFIQVR